LESLTEVIYMSKIKLASRILKVGKNKVWVDPQNLKKLEEAITAEDIRGLIKQGIIRKKVEKGHSKGRTRILKIQKAKGRRRGHGSRKGKKGARENKEALWVKKIRALRKELKKYKESGEISKEVYWKFYRMAKGNFFRSKKHMRAYLEKYKSGGANEVEQDLLAETKEKA
jgi:large subunit ribosomal protein L19e